MFVRSHRRFDWSRLAVAGFALCLMLLLTLHAPMGALGFTAQHTAGSHADHSRQPCLDSASFDSTLPEAAFSLAFVSHSTRLPVRVNVIAYSTSLTEFRLYNRPPPLG
jgi:hypothetical protein